MFDESNNSKIKDCQNDSIFINSFFSFLNNWSLNPLPPLSKKKKETHLTLNTHKERQKITLRQRWYPSLGSVVNIRPKILLSFVPFSTFFSFSPPYVYWINVESRVVHEKKFHIFDRIRTATMFSFCTFISIHYTNVFLSDCSKLAKINS